MPDFSWRHAVTVRDRDGALRTQARSPRVQPVRSRSSLASLNLPVMPPSADFFELDGQNA